MRSASLLLLTLFLSASLESYSAGEKKKWELKFKINGLTDTTFFLSNFYAKNQYYYDTARSDSKGLLVFSGENEIEEGMYSLVLGNRKIMDLFVVEKFIEFETDTVNTVRNMKIKGSKENQLFYEYMSYLRNMEDRVAPIHNKMKDASDEEKKEMNSIFPFQN